VSKKEDWGRKGRQKHEEAEPTRFRRGVYSDRRQRQLRSAADAKFLVDMMQVHLHGAFRQIEFAGDFLVAETSRYKVGDFSFA